MPNATHVQHVACASRRRIARRAEPPESQRRAAALEQHPGIGARPIGDGERQEREQDRKRPAPQGSLRRAWGPRRRCVRDGVPGPSALDAVLVDQAVEGVDHLVRADALVREQVHEVGLGEGAEGALLRRGHPEQVSEGREALALAVQAFKHGLGHGVGFQAINHSAAPILHPASDAVLQAGMVHNVEPAVYLAGKGGIRLNDNVVVQPAGAELLSREVPRDLDWLVVREY